MSTFGVVVGDVVADFELGFGQAGEVAAVEQFSFEAAPERFGVGVIVAVAAPAPALLGPVSGDQGFETRGGVLAALIGVDDEPSPAEGRRTASARGRASLTKSSGMVSRTS
jgi:hypothetical protein